MGDLSPTSMPKRHSHFCGLRFASCRLLKNILTETFYYKTRVLIPLPHFYGFIYFSRRHPVLQGLGLIHKMCGKWVVGYSELPQQRPVVAIVFFTIPLTRSFALGT